MLLLYKNLIVKTKPLASNKGSGKNFTLDNNKNKYRKILFN